MNNNDQEVDKTPSANLLSVIKDLAGLISTVAGFFVVMLYLAGRSYASGYFDAMSIPPSHISFTVWEYSESAWFPIFFYSFVMTIVGATISFVGSLLLRLLAWVWDKVTEWWKNRKKNHKPIVENFPKLDNSAKSMLYVIFFAVWGLSVIFSVNYALMFVKGYGQNIGRNTVLDGSNRIEISSTSPQNLGDPELIASANGQTNVYIYKGLRLLTYNNGKYYLFKEIDQDTCKPIQVYVVGADQYTQVNILPAESLTPKCKGPTK